jgi:hypothetical protein
MPACCCARRGRACSLRGRHAFGAARVCVKMTYTIAQIKAFFGIE